MSTPKDSASASIPAPASTPRTWRAGTLTYTSGGLVILFCWLLFGDFSWSMRDRSVGSMAQWYLNNIGVPNFLFGLLFTSLPACIGLVLSPVISVKSDRHRGPRGRRIPFLLVTTPIAASGMIGIALTPILSAWIHKNLFPGGSELVVTVICFGIFWTAFDFATIAGSAVFGGLINDVVPKQLLGRFYGLFRAISLIDGIVFNFWLMGKTPRYFTLMLLVIGVFYGVAFMWVCYKVKEGDYPPPPPRPKSKNPAGGIKTYFRECYSRPYYVMIYLFIALVYLSAAPVNTFALRYADSLGLSMDTYGKGLAITYTCSLCLAWFIGWLVDRFHPLRMTMFAVAGYLAISVWGHFYATTQMTFLVAWVMHGVLSGCMWTSMATLGQRLFPHEKFAQYASAISFLSSPLLMCVAPLVGVFIDRSGNIYRYTFTFGVCFSIVALVCGWIVYRQFMRLGGPRNYVAPE
jgi:MFS family permease